MSPLIHIVIIFKYKVDFSEIFKFGAHSVCNQNM
jgi:hypothetical protein